MQMSRFCFHPNSYGAAERRMLLTNKSSHVELFSSTKKGKEKTVDVVRCVGVEDVWLLF